MKRNKIASSHGLEQWVQVAYETETEKRERQRRVAIRSDAHCLLRISILYSGIRANGLSCAPCERRMRRENTNKNMCAIRCSTDSISLSLSLCLSLSLSPISTRRVYPLCSCMPHYYKTQARKRVYTRDWLSLRLDIARVCVCMSVRYALVFLFLLFIRILTIRKAFCVFCLGIMENCLSVIPATWLTIDDSSQCAATIRFPILFNTQTAMDKNKPNRRHTDVWLFFSEVDIFGALFCNSLFLIECVLSTNTNTHTHTHRRK